jgi:hypothetical protein
MSFTSRKILINRNINQANLFTWGYNLSGQLGDGTLVNKSSPVQIGSLSWSKVTARTSNTAAIRGFTI